MHACKKIREREKDEKNEQERTQASRRKRENEKLFIYILEEQPYNRTNERATECKLCLHTARFS